MAEKKRTKFFETRYFGLIIGALLVVLLILTAEYTDIINRIELKMLDTHFNLKSSIRSERLQEGVTYKRRNPNISPDILILGIDFKSLSKFGKWPFPRYRHANLLDAFSRIKNQEERERAIFLDLFFIEPDKKAYDDALLVQSIRDNGRVFLETVLEIDPPLAGAEEELYGRHEALFEAYGKIKNVTGNWQDVPPYPGLQPPLKPFGAAVRGYGHANFSEDYDKIFRRQALIAKSSVLKEIIKLDDLNPSVTLDEENFERFVWIDTNGFHHNIEYPLTEQNLADLRREMIDAEAPQKAEDTDEDGEPDLMYYVVRKYQDNFVPSITLALALEYFNKDLSDVEVVLGEHILIEEPEYFDYKTQEWVPYEIMVTPDEYDEEGNIIAEGEREVQDKIEIPINENGEMLINFMGIPSSASAEGHQTFPIRSYSGYAASVPSPDPARWPRTKSVANKLLMVGPFTKGMAADEKPTPYGLMFGVEIHANSLNTILMNKFIHYASYGINLAFLIGLVMITAFMSSRLSTVWSLVIVLVLVFAFFIAVTLTFDNNAYIINFSSPAIGMLLTFLGVVVYRVMTEEKDKKRIRDMFGKYVSPDVVDEILDNPPELGGIDKELTVCFSDIRGFTTLSESMTPQELVNHLNIYLTAMTDIILDYQGTLDKYVGDEIMWFFGAPLPQEEHAMIACECALKQMQVLNELNDSWPPERRINIGIGLNSGIMTVGNMGSMGRMNYTLMGDNVNLGARLEGTNKQYMTNIIISEYTYGLVKDRIISRELDNIRVKGKNKPVLIYELIDIVDGAGTAQDGNGQKG